MSTAKSERSPRIQKLLEVLYSQGKKDRSTEWFKTAKTMNIPAEPSEELTVINDGDFEDIAKLHHDKPVIIRKAYAIKEMLEKMTNKEISKRTHTYNINDGELIVGVLPMGSNGLGKVFPNYLTLDEERMGSLTNRNENSILGHNTVNYDVLLGKGLRGIIAEAKENLKKREETKDKWYEERKHTENEKYEDLQSQIDFYHAVIISCEAVAAYANRFADLAEEQAKSLPEDNERKTELLEIAGICRKVPMDKPDTFREALQAIYTFHLALHASMNLISLGRLDQVLVKYLDKNKLNSENEKEEYIAECTELFECFIIKAAWRLNMTTEYLMEQDHIDHYASLGIHQFSLDQRAGVNNFLQNIIVGGKTPEGEDATNEMTYIILDAFKNLNLSTPGIYVRMHKHSKDKLKKAVAEMLATTKNLPGILNDDVLIPALYQSLIDNDTSDRPETEKAKEYRPLANDYCVDGCWEPILNGISDWTFGMVKGMNIMQCALNRGATLSDNPGLLRGDKKSFMSEEVANYSDFKEMFKGHMQFFVDQSVLGLYVYYMLDEFVTPSPLLSSVMGTCLEKGRDKSWGGTKYNIGGTILVGVPDMVNTIAAIKRWVFDRKKYTLPDALDAMRCDFGNKMKKDNPADKARYEEMKKDFDDNSPKFGSNDTEAVEIGKFILDVYCNAIKQAEKLAEKVFLKPISDLSEKEKREISRLRKIAGYYGHSLQAKFGKDFNICFTAGCGTFEQYPQQGIGILASANRKSDGALAPNFSPTPGTVHESAAHVLKSLKELGLERLSAGAITDLCIEDGADADYIEGLLEGFIECNGNMLTLALGNSAEYQEIYDLSEKASKMKNPKAVYEELQEKYGHINVRVGGWQAPFISMSLDQQKNYINRVLEIKG